MVDIAPLSPHELGTFCGVPRGGIDTTTKAAILGIPFDMGNNPTRIGSRQGPDHIRRCSVPERRYLFHSDRDPIDQLGVVDCGNVAVVPSRAEAAFEHIEAAVAGIHGAGVLPVTMGGDGSVTLPQLRAAKAAHGELAVVHCDAHTDAWDVDGAGPYTTTTTFLRAHEEGLVDPELTFHVGARGSLSSLGGTSTAVSRLGHRIVGADEFADRGHGDVADELAAAIGDRAVYVCWDMDFFDPSAAPGVAVPEWGGPSVLEALRFLRRLGSLHAVAYDVNTVSPPHDVQDMTGHLAARVIVEFLDLIAGRRSPAG
ncbi:MAG TPA: arginase family protein [Streptosporangiales bacterium]